MGVYLRGKTYWGRYTDKNKKQQRISLKTKNKKDAERQLKEIIGDTDTYTLLEVYERWHQDNSFRLSKNYTSLVARAVSKYCYPRHNPLITKIDTRSISEHQHFLSLKYNKTTISMYMKQFKIIIDYALKLELIDKNPFDTVKIVKPLAREESLTYEQVFAIISTARKTNPLYSYYIEFLFLTGMRAGELENLEWDNISETAIDILITKGDPRLHNINDELAQCIQNIRYLQPENCKYIFSRTSGKWLGENRYMTKIFRKFANRAGIPKKFVCHSLRHTYATMLRDSGVSADDIQLLLGHKALKTTLKYIKRGAQDVITPTRFYLK